MIETPTVLILGAGASTHLGYPTGQELLNEVCKRCKRVEYEDIYRQCFGSDLVDRFLLRLSQSGYYSVDAFLEQNSAFTDIGKFAIASCLKSWELTDRLFPPHNPGWYQALFNSLCTPDISDFAQNRLTVITFNYDRALEHYLFRAIKARYDLDDEKALNTMQTIPMIHVHGILGAYPDVPYKHRVLSNREILQIASSIKVIHEVNDPKKGFCSDDFEKANAALHASRKIYFLGFGFLDANLRRFQFFNPETTLGREILSTCVGYYAPQRIRLIERLKQYGFESKIFPNGKPDCERLLNLWGELK